MSTDSTCHGQGETRAVGEVEGGPEDTNGYARAKGEPWNWRTEISTIKVASDTRLIGATIRPRFAWLPLPVVLSQSVHDNPPGLERKGDMEARGRGRGRGERGEGGEA